MKKILAMIMAVAMILVSAALPAYAAETVDYSGYLTELKALMDQCAAAGIPTDYELVSYSTIERFQEWINEDVAGGIDNTTIAYEKASIETLYTETKANLEAYLEGTKEPLVAKRPDMNNLEIKGAYVYDGETPVFSIGYGHGGEAMADMHRFQNFGVNNIQFEIGPSHTYNQRKGLWYEKQFADQVTLNDNVKWSHDTTKARTGTHSLYMKHSDDSQNGKEFAIEQEIYLEPGTYTLSFWATGTVADHDDDTYKHHQIVRIPNVGEGWFRLTDMYGGTTEGDWKKFSQEFTVEEGKTVNNVSIGIMGYGTTGLYIDDVSIVNSSGTEFIKNGSFEDTTTTYIPALENVKNYLKLAEKYNIAVSLLLSPHYLPEEYKTDETLKLKVGYREDNRGFLKYNIHTDAAKKIVGDHISTVLAEVKDYKAIDNIVLSNEPAFDTRWYESFYQQRFAEYLVDKYGSLSAAGEVHGKTYNSSGDVEMPKETFTILGYKYTKDALAYDWMEYNNKEFTDWHKWMADIVKEYMPDTPVHSKVIENMRHDDAVDREELSHGKDFDMLGEFSGYSGIDNLEHHEEGYYETLFTYDYLQSSVGKPVYNSEEHIIKDNGVDYEGDANEAWAFTTDVSKIALMKMWQGAVHGRSLSTVWVWSRKDVGEEFYGSVLYRPELVDGIGKMNLDLMRLSDELVELQTKSNKVALFYSTTSRLLTEASSGINSDQEFMKGLFPIYKELLANGYDVGVVTEKSIDKLSEYDTLIIPPYATHTTQAALTAIENFASGSGKVLRGNADVLTKNEQNGSLSPNISGVDTYNVSKLPAKTVVLKDISGNDVSGIDWQYSETEDRILINATSDTAQSFDVYYKGTKLANMTDLINNETELTTVSLAANEPKLLEYRITPEAPATGEADIVNLTYVKYGDTYELTWDIVGANYDKANVYKYNDDGTVKLLGSTVYDKYTYDEAGTYIVCPVTTDGTEYEGKVITTAAADSSAEITGVTQGTDSYAIDVNNITGHYLRCKVVVEFLDADNTALKYGYSKAFIAPGKSNKLQVIMTKPDSFSKAKISVFDGLDNILATQDITSN